MTTRIDVTHNVGDVIESINDVKHDIKRELRKKVGAIMTVLKMDARTYVRDDPETSGQLRRAIGEDSDTSGLELEWTVGVDLQQAAYAAIVEFGSGMRTEIPHPTGNRVPPSWPSMGSAVPTGYPYESPDIEHNEDVPHDTSGYPNFYGFVKHIEEWMREKNLEPYTGSYFVSAAYIASTIVKRGTHAHPYLRPAWFDNELEIKRAAKNALRSASR